MESTECIAAHSIASTILLRSATITVATSSRTADSTPPGVSRSSAVVVMGLLNQAPPTVLRFLIPLSTRKPGLSEVVRRGLDTLAGARYSTTEYGSLRPPGRASYQTSACDAVPDHRAHV